MLPPSFRIKAKIPYQLLLSHARLETTSLLLNHHELRLTTKMHHEAMNRLRRVLEVLDVVNRSKRFLSAAMALCNEIAARLSCSRVSLGISQWPLRTGTGDEPYGYIRSRDGGGSGD